MSGKRNSPPSSGIEFLESGHEDRFMEEMFDQINQVPDKETPPEHVEKTKQKVTRDSPFAALSGPEAQIDLHGKTRDEAIKEVGIFVKTCHTRKLCNILIITGKGQHSGERGPVLKKEVEKWLRTSGRPLIRRFHDAPPRYGGSGALWIELK